MKPPSTGANLGYMEGPRKLPASVTGKTLMMIPKYALIFKSKKEKSYRRTHDSIHEREPLIRWFLLFPSHYKSDGNYDRECCIDAYTF